MSDDYGDGLLRDRRYLREHRHKEKGMNSGVWLNDTDYALLLQLQSTLQSRSSTRVSLSDVLRHGLRTLAVTEGIVV